MKSKIVYFHFKLVISFIDSYVKIICQFRRFLTAVELVVKFLGHNFNS